MKKLLGILIAVLLSLEVSANEILYFSDLESLLHYAEGSSSMMKSSRQEALLAKWTKITAYFNTINFKSNAVASAIDNTQLPVSFLPAEMFGGPAGTYKQVALGQQYVSSFTIIPQIDIINLEYWAKANSAKANEAMVGANNLLAKRTLFESIAANYYNIRLLDRQLRALEESLMANDTILVIMRSKFRQGLVKQQEVNDAEVNKIVLEDKLSQTKHNVNKQYISLKILCDIPLESEIKILDNEPLKEFNTALVAYSILDYQASALKKKFAQVEYSAAKKANLPVLSFVSSYAWQNNSNAQFLDTNTSWIKSNYLGLKLTMPFPVDMNKFSMTTLARYQANMASINLEHTKIQNQLNNKQITLDYETSYKQVLDYKRIYQLKRDNYFKNRNLYDAQLLALDKLLLSFNDMINSELNMITAQMNNQYYHAKININNSVQ